jgi:hypothetical protein
VILFRAAKRKTLRTGQHQRGRGRPLTNGPAAFGVRFFAANRAYEDKDVVLAKLAESERQEWRKMWSDGGDRLAGTQGKTREKKQDGFSNRPT